MLVIKPAAVLTPDIFLKDVSIVIDDRIIKKITENPVTKIGAEIIKCENCIAVPGFIDIHIHGYGGIDVNLINSEKDLKKMAKLLCKHGVTTFLPATVSLPIEKLVKITELTYYALKYENDHAEIAGIYFEGPYLNKEKAGAQNPEYIKEPNVKEIEKIYKASRGLMKIMALAPELPGALEVIRRLNKLGVIASAAHTNAKFHEAMIAFDAGVKLCTHLFNGMKTFHHREPGITTAALLRDDVYVEFIGDLIHLHPATIKLIYKNKPFDKIIAITDSISATGFPNGEYELGGLPIIVREGISKLRDNGSLAGSTLTLDQALRNLVFKVGMPLIDTLRFMTKNPAELLGLKDRGILQPGFRADIVLLNKETLKIENVIIRGKCVC